MLALSRIGTQSLSVQAVKAYISDRATTAFGNCAVGPSW